MDLSQRKTMEDEPLWLTKFLIAGIFKYRVIKYGFLAGFVLHVVNYFVELYTLCTHPQYFLKYGPWIMGKPFGFFAYVAMLTHMEFNALWSDFRRWSIDSAGAETKKNIQKQIRNYHVILAITLTVCGIYALVVMYPNPSDCDISLNMFLFNNYYPEYSIVFNFVAKLSFTPVFVSMLLIILNMSYGAEHCVYQWYLLLEYLKCITAEYDGEDEAALLEDENYQSIVKKRIKSCVERHVEFLILARKINVRVVQPLFTFAAVFGFLFLFYLTMTIYGIYVGVYENTYLNIAAITLLTCTASICLATFVNDGQMIEDESENVLDELVQSFRWISFNKSNRNTILIVLIQTQNYVSIRLTENLACNYAFGLQMIKGLYSAISVFITIRK